MTALLVVAGVILAWVFLPWWAAGLLTYVCLMYEPG